MVSTWRHYCSTVALLPKCPETTCRGLSTLLPIRMKACVLKLAFGRPRIIYVLYPAPDGSNVVCRGAVLPYYEFRSAKRLDDLEWKAMLDSKNAPDQPAWLPSTGRETRIVRNGLWVAGALVILLAVWTMRLSATPTDRRRCPAAGMTSFRLAECHGHCPSFFETKTRMFVA